jgi:DNA-binding HxlR family transcriptional regulator
VGRFSGSRGWPDGGAADGHSWVDPSRSVVCCKSQHTTHWRSTQVPRYDADVTEQTAVDPSPTALEAALVRVGDRWSLLVVDALLEGPRRFGELRAALPGIAPNILTDRLRRLERAGIVRSTPYQERPTRLAYDLTADGRDLASALRLLADWGTRGLTDAEPLRHVTCGTALETRWFCPTCAIAVDAAEAPDDRLL